MPQSRGKAWSLSDSQGILLQIQPNGSKLWRFKYRFLDKQKTLHLGGWPQVSLADARVQRHDAKKQITAGVDPALGKKRARIAAKYAAANTFQAVAKEWLVKCERDGLPPLPFPAQGKRDRPMCKNDQSCTAADGF